MMDAASTESRRGPKAAGIAAMTFGALVAAACLAFGASAGARNAPAITAAPPEPPPPPPPTVTFPTPPLPTAPRPSLILEPTDTFSPTTVAPTTSTTPTGSTDDTGTEATEPVATEPGGGAGSSGSATGETQYTVTVTAAQIDCEGSLTVAYDTVAVPQPQLAANHLVVVNPLSDPSSFEEVETEGNPANGSFTFDHTGTAGEGYRVFVVAEFDPPNPDGPVAVDRAVVQPATGC